MDALLNKNPFEILAYQYDMVCNGVELASGAVRNHKPEIMYKAFELAGYDHSVVDNKFGGMINAFKYGAPPHAGCAPGIDRTVMLLLDEPIIRDVIYHWDEVNVQCNYLYNTPLETDTDLYRYLCLSTPSPATVRIISGFTITP